MKLKKIIVIHTSHISNSDFHMDVNVFKIFGWNSDMRLPSSPPT